MEVHEHVPIRIIKIMLRYLLRSGLFEQSLNLLTLLERIVRRCPIPCNIRNVSGMPTSAYTITITLPS